MPVSTAARSVLTVLRKASEHPGFVRYEASVDGEVLASADLHEDCDAPDFPALLGALVRRAPAPPTTPHLRLL